MSDKSRKIDDGELDNALCNGQDDGEPNVSVLLQLDADFKRAKEEQILRFLHDQEELNNRFREFELDADDEDDDGEDEEDGGERTAETQLREKLALYKARIYVETPMECESIASDEETRSDDSDYETIRVKKVPATLTNNTQIVGTTTRRGTKGATCSGGTQGAQKRTLSKVNTRPKTAMGVRRMPTAHELNIYSPDNQRYRSAQARLIESHDGPLRRHPTATLSRRTSWEHGKRGSSNSIFSSSLSKPTTSSSGGTHIGTDSGMRQSYPMGKCEDTRTQYPTSTTPVGTRNPRNTRLIALDPQTTLKGISRIQYQENRQDQRHSSSAGHRKHKTVSDLNTIANSPGRGKHIAVLKLPPLDNTLPSHTLARGAAPLNPPPCANTLAEYLAL